MKSIYKYLILGVLCVSFAACTDDPLIEDSKNLEKDSYYKGVEDGYSIAFDITLDDLSGNAGTRGGYDWNDYQLSELENYLNPEEFRVLFFDQNDKFLFESGTRWLTEIEAKDGNRRWRVGVPIFQYIGDGYSNDEEGTEESESYNWDKIVELMKTNSFKIAILANRPTTVTIPALNDFPAEWDYFGSVPAKNGPFWGPANSVARDETREWDEDIADVFDLHHCQDDPLYMSKNCLKGSEEDANGRPTSTSYMGYYDFISKVESQVNASWTNQTFPMPRMGAFCTWLSNQQYTLQDVGSTKADKTVYQSQYRLIKMIGPNGVRGNNKDGIPCYSTDDDEELYIPMYGIQRFDPIIDWTKGTTYNVSTQTASQSTNYNYKTIFLLRACVKLELRIPMFKGDKFVEIDLDNAQLMYNNSMSRCEPMDVWHPTDSIWGVEHQKEWKNILAYGPFANNQSYDSPLDFQKRLSWFYGIWASEKNWDFSNGGANKYWTTPNTKDEQFGTRTSEKNYPRVFNVMTQRLKCAYIRLCYLPIGDCVNSDGTINKTKVDKNAYHRWVIYCGERNINDPSSLGTLSGNVDKLNGSSYVSYFRIYNKTDKVIYSIPIVDYNTGKTIGKKNPAIDYLKENPNAGTDAGGWPIDNITKSNKFMDSYELGIMKFKTDDFTYKNSTSTVAFDDRLTPLPLVRNHFYRLTVSFGDNGNLNVELMDAQERSTDWITFN